MPGDTLGAGGGEATFSKVPAHYPDPGNSGYYMNVFKTPTTLNDGQQQSVNNFAPRANLNCVFKTVPFHLALVIMRWRGGGGGGGGASKIYQQPQQGPCKNMSFFQNIFTPPPRRNKCT
jgi:hypothetical protein